MKNAQDHPSHVSHRKLAEWVSLIASALLILGVAAVLIYNAVQPNEPVVNVTAAAAPGAARERPARLSVRAARNLLRQSAVMFGAVGCPCEYSDDHRKMRHEPLRVKPDALIRC